eukprot:snap_masked-scaffold_7-processed-gene-3.23-mRNA-1 protein AED:1.00 eAED:1.00 QI:0/0/0/0/1/1/2/0/246
MAPPQIIRDHMEGILNTISGLFLVVGLIIIGFGLFLTIVLNSSLYESSLGTPIIIIFGILGTARDNNIFIGLYVAGAAVSALALLVCGITLFKYMEYFAGVADSKVDIDIEAEIMNFELAIYTDCCEGLSDNVLPAITCFEADNVFPCIEDEEEYAKYLRAINNKTCNAFASIGFVAQPEDQGCGFGNPEIFVVQLAGFFRGNLYFLAITNVILSVIMVLSLIPAIYLLATKEEEKRKGVLKPRAH